MFHFILLLNHNVELFYINIFNFNGHLKFNPLKFLGSE